MFGLFRTVLSLMVMSFHLYLKALPFGIYPVFAFYILSGYLMTFIMHHSYGYTLPGRISFAFNRFLRLYPQYWIAALFSVLLIFVLSPENALQYHRSMYLPATALGYISNSLMMFWALPWEPIGFNPRLVPPTWALTVEIFFYFVIALGLSRNFQTTKIWVLISLMYVAGSLYLGQPWTYRYFTIAAGSLPCSIGSALYFISKRYSQTEITKRIVRSTRFLFFLMLGNCFLWTWFALFEQKGPYEFGLYVNLVICALLIYAIANGGVIISFDKSIDKMIGNFSYPIYLLHWQVGLLVSYILYGRSLHQFSTQGFLSLCISFLVVLVISSLLIFFIEKPIENIRNKVRSARMIKNSA